MWIDIASVVSYDVDPARMIGAPSGESNMLDFVLVLLKLMSGGLTSADVQEPPPPPQGPNPRPGDPPED